MIGSVAIGAENELKDLKVMFALSISILLIASVKIRKVICKVHYGQTLK